jgi:hypothetical protein
VKSELLISEPLKLPFVKFTPLKLAEVKSQFLQTLAGLTNFKSLISKLKLGLLRNNIKKEAINNCLFI